jgi:CRISPR-associated protein Cas5t
MAYGFRVNIVQPTAHFRVPFTYSRRHTYPLPPYSTVIGLLANLLGIRGQNDPAFVRLLHLKIALAGRFESKTTEYLWFRNLSVAAHKTRFGSTQIRSLQGVAEHPGGQMPVRVDVLENLTLWIWLAHEDRDFLRSLHDAFTTPRPRDVLHLGRAEDWLILEEVGPVTALQEMLGVDRFGGATPWFHWIPEHPYIPGELHEEFGEKLPARTWPEYGGLRQRITSFYRIESGRRNFIWVDVKLAEGNWPPGYPRLVDRETDVPVWFWHLSEEERKEWEA